MTEQLKTIKQVKQYLGPIRDKSQTIALVPTMGFFHKGHLSLMEMAREQADRVIISIFVNPTQFGPNEDLDKYPRNLSRDIELASEAGVDAAFIPTPEEIYPSGFQTWVNVSGLSRGLCGASRPNHFRGVATVVLKLFNIIQPDIAIFGQKDYQQLLIIRQMARDLNLSVKIIAHPIVREPDGLAMSSRNAYLDQQERKSALCLYNSLQLAQNLISQGQDSVSFIHDEMEQLIKNTPGAKIDYIFIGSSETLEPYDTILRGRTLIALAVWIGSTRLIDNIIL